RAMFAWPACSALSSYSSPFRSLSAAFDVYGLHRVAAQMDARNSASARLAERVGMRREAHLRSNWWCKGEWTDTLIYARLADDPRSEEHTSELQSRENLVCRLLL